jgi:hypothetical protein
MDTFEADGWNLVSLGLSTCQERRAHEEKPPLAGWLEEHPDWVTVGELPHRCQLSCLVGH